MEHTGVLEGVNKFEYRKYKYLSAKMIPATLNSVRWDEVNQIKYRFQAVQFSSDVFNGLVENSHPCSRREKTFIERPKEQNRYHTNANSASKFNYQQVKYSCGNSSFDYSNSTMVKKPRRKATVVQITKDETSDYNTDEESFSDEHQTCNTTLFHVENRQIRDCFEIQVTKRPINRKSKIHASEYKCKTFKPVSNGKYRKDRLELKSKEELIEMVHHLFSIVDHKIIDQKRDIQTTGIFQEKI